MKLLCQETLVECNCLACYCRRRQYCTPIPSQVTHVQLIADRHYLFTLTTLHKVDITDPFVREQSICEPREDVRRFLTFWDLNTNLIALRDDFENSCK